MMSDFWKAATCVFLNSFSMDTSIRLVSEKITLADLKEIAINGFGDMVKAVVDIEKGVMAIGAEMHADAEAWLLERGSEQANLWGINIYPDALEPERVEFDSMINIRPRQGNRSRGVEDESKRKKILAIVRRLVS